MTEPARSRRLANRMPRASAREGARLLSSAAAPAPRRRRPSAAIRAAAALLLGAATLTLLACSGGSSGSGPAVPAQVRGLEGQMVGVVKEIEPEVAQITSSHGLGSGVIFDKAGDIVTNAHVIEGATAIRVTLADGERFPASVVHAYAPDDLAVIKISSGRPLKPARFADSTSVEAGDMVLAVGNPLGLASSVTDGIVSGLGRNVIESHAVVLPDVIQTSAPINSGNSGGALADLAGSVIGIPTIAAVDPQLGAAATGIGFAIPSNIVRDIAGQIVRYGRVVNSHRAAIGASLTDGLERPGALVTALEAGGPAQTAGIRVGDSIEAIEGERVTHADLLAAALATFRPHDTVKLSITRPDGSSAEVEVRLGELHGG